MKVKSIIIVMIFVISITSCTKDIEVDYPYIYQLALDELISEDTTSFIVANYIAIDLASLTELSEAEKEKLMDYLGKYDVDIINESYESIEDGLLINDDYLDGILLNVTSIEKVSSKEIHIELEKFKSRKQAIGLVLIFEYDRGWKLKEKRDAWES